MQYIQCTCIQTLINLSLSINSTAIQKSCAATWTSSSNVSIQSKKQNEKARLGRLGIAGQYPDSVSTMASLLHLQNMTSAIWGTPRESYFCMSFAISNC